MDDATQKLVDDAREYASTGPVFARDYITRLAAALEAAYDQMESFVEAGLLSRINGQYEPSASMIAALEAAQRPPVSPEVREALAATMREHYVGPDATPDGHGVCVCGGWVGDDMNPEDWDDHLTDAILARFSVPSRPEVSPEAREVMRDALRKAHEYDHDFDPEYDYTDDDERYIDAILARFSVPLQPVYDEEAIARVLGEHRLISARCRCGFDPRLDYFAFELHQAAALVAALRGGELTREETTL